MVESLDSDSGVSMQLNKWMTSGNAAYILNGNGQELSQRSRFDLLAGHGGDFDRVIHRAGWQEKFTRLLRRHLGDPPRWMGNRRLEPAK